LFNYLIVVFFNAFTDLGHKIIIQNTIFKVYDGDQQIILTTVVNIFILLPFILLFTPSGFLADKYPKNSIMKYSAFFAILITSLITLSYYQGWFYVAFWLTFLLSMQSAIYAPAKYGYIKELVKEEKITSANASVQAVTTVAILGGIIFYTILFENDIGDNFHTKEAILKHITHLGYLLIIGSVIEFLVASTLPNKQDKSEIKKFDLAKYIRFFYLRKNLKIVGRKKEISLSIIVLGLFWSISQVILAVFGEYAKSDLGITNTIYVQGVMALAGIGIVFGSVLVSILSKRYINLGFVVLGSMGISVIIFVLPMMKSMLIIGGLFLVFGIFSAFLIVPLNAYIQKISPKKHLGTILAGNNFIQNIFMFCFLLLTTAVAYFGVQSRVLIYLMGFVALFMSFLIFKTQRVMAFWALMEMIFKLRHRYTYEGLEHIPKDKAVLLLGNHTSWIDWLILQYPLEKRVSFLMNKEVYNWRFFHSIFKMGRAIPVSSRGAKDAFVEIHKRLKDKEIVALFPEGAITTDGELGKFYKGYEIIPKDFDGVIIPFFIDGVFGSRFAKYKQKKAFRFRRDIKVYFDKPVSLDTNSQELKEIIIKMKEKYEVK